MSVRLSEPFWRDCSELPTAAVERWLLASGLAPWLAARRLCWSWCPSAATG